jgi:large subunit ribosomal protein L29
MESVEIKKLSDKELNEKVTNEESMLVKLRLQHAVSPIENPMRVRAQRKLVARLLTEVNARAKGVKAPAAVAKAPVAKKTAAPKAKTVKAKATAKTK